MPRKDWPASASSTGEFQDIFFQGDFHGGFFPFCGAARPGPSGTRRPPCIELQAAGAVEFSSLGIEQDGHGLAFPEGSRLLPV